MSTFDTRNFRNALGRFATGVTIITTMSHDNAPVGVTASSFNSVSLNPPLVLWSLAKSSSSMSAFSAAGHFAIHILTSKQDALSNQFAKSGGDKFANVEWTKGELGSPLLSEYAACFQCRTVHQYEGGDHVIFVGEVVRFEARERSPLVFHLGSYAETRPKHKDPASRDNHEAEEGRFTDDFFLHLLSRAYFQTSMPIRRKLSDMRISEAEFRALSLLSMEDALPVSVVARRLAAIGFHFDHDAMRSLHERGYVAYYSQAKDPPVSLAGPGRQAFISVLTFAKAVEEQLLAHFSGGEIADAKHLLKRLTSIAAQAPE